MKRASGLKKYRNAAARIAVGLALATTLVAAAQNDAGGSRPENVVIRAMADELARSMTELQVGELDPPYFIQYIVLEEKEFSSAATFGALTGSNWLEQRFVHSQVRVGSYDFDNYEFSGGGGGNAQVGVLLQASVDDDYESVRHNLWLATDSAYKSAVETIARKRAFVQNTVQDEEIPDFSQEQATVSVASKAALEFDQEAVENNLREWSRIFRDFPEVRSSNVSFRARLSHRYIVNSEGTQTLRPELTLSLVARATTQLADGMEISHSLPFYARSFDELPTPAAVAAAIRQLGSDIAALYSAPVIDADYSGPVLLTGQAATEMFARVLAPSLTLHRGPLGQRGQGSASPLMDRMNRPVLPAYVSVYDDPAALEYADQALIGYYEIDDQGIPSRRVSLIEEGLLVDMLSSRRPDSFRLQSTGHGRNGYPGREAAQVSNLIVTASEGKTYEELKAQLLELCVDERLDFGYIIKSTTGGGGSFGSPFLVYKVYVEDGREELVRGASATGLAVQSLRHIQAVGSDLYVSNRLVGTQGVETPTSIAAPSVLLQELRLTRPTGSQQRPALMTHPFFSN